MSGAVARTVFTLALLASFAVRTAMRLPAWDSDRTIWVAAAATDRDDPWALNNAAHFRHDTQTVPLLVQLVALPVPDWLPVDERSPYLAGYAGLSDTFRLNGYLEASAIVDQQTEALLKFRPLPVVRFAFNK